MTSPSQPTSPSVDAETLKNDLASSLVIAWDRYVSLFGEPPHGTGKQIRSLLSFVPIAALSAPRVEPVATHSQISQLDDASNACLELAAKHGYATGHGDTVGDMIREFSAQIAPPSQPDTGLARNDPAILRRRIANLEAVIEKSADREAAQPDTGAREALRRIVEGYADSYRMMANDGDGKVLASSVHTDFLCNILPAILAALPPDAGSREPALDPATVEVCAKEAEVWQGLKGPKLADKIRALAGKEGE